MLDKIPTLGSIESSDNEKRILAVRSMESNVKDPVFRKLFPTLVKNYKQNLTVRGHISQRSVVEEGDDPTENDGQGEKSQSHQDDNDAQNNNDNKVPNNGNNVLPRGAVLKAVGVAVAIIFLSVWSRVYM